jgi:F-type H+-transporting ATPase subunit a
VSDRGKILWGIAGFYVLGLILLAVIFGVSTHTNNAFQPQNEFKLVNWVSLGVFSINRAVLYLVLASLLTIFTMVYILFIWFCNLIGYLPLPTNSEEKFTIFGAQIPSFALYAATANVSVPLVLALITFIAFNWAGIRTQGPIGYLKSLIPSGVSGPILILIAPLEVISVFMRLISLTVRLFANILAGHMIILFMAGGLAVILGASWLGWFTLPFGIAIYLFELGLVATLQAFIFATLSAIYLGGAVTHH